MRQYQIFGWPLLILLTVQVACAAQPLSRAATSAGESNIDTQQASPKSDLPPSAIGQIESILKEKAARTPAQQKISSQLLYAMKTQRGEDVARGVQKLRTGVKVEADGTTLVDIKAQVTKEVLTQIEVLGGTVISSFPQYQAIRARIPLGQIEALACEHWPAAACVRPARARSESLPATMFGHGFAAK